MAKKKKLKRFTVILSYPDYLTDCDPETYVNCVLAEDFSDAIAKSQRKAAKLNEVDVDCHEDFALIGAIKGWVMVYRGI